MGYSEVGGDDSVQVSIHLRHPRGPQVEEGSPASVHANADAQNQRSGQARAKANAATPGRAYRGQDAQSANATDKNTADAWNVFEVSIHFSRQSDINAARAALAAVAVGGTATFPLKVVRMPGQVHVSWPDGPGGGGNP